jgi:hypothetical protein
MLIQAIEGCNAAAVNHAPGEVFDAAPEDAAVLIAHGQAVMGGECPAPTGGMHSVVIGDQAAFVSYAEGTFGPGARSVTDAELALLWGKRYVFVSPDGGDL